MTARGITDVYPGRLVYITIASLGKVNLQLSRHQNFGEVADATVEIVHVNNESFSYPFSLNDKVDSLVSCTLQADSDSLERMAKIEAVKEEGKERPKMGWRQDVQLPAKFMTHSPAFFESARGVREHVGKASKAH